MSNVVTIYPTLTEEESKVARQLLHGSKADKRIARLVLEPEGQPRQHVLMALSAVRAEIERREEDA